MFRRLLCSPGTCNSALETQFPVKNQENSLERTKRERQASIANEKLPQEGYTAEAQPHPTFDLMERLVSRRNGFISITYVGQQARVLHTVLVGNE